MTFNIWVKYTYNNQIPNAKNAHIVKLTTNSDCMLMYDIPSYILSLIRAWSKCYKIISLLRDVRTFQLSARP